MPYACQLLGTMDPCIVKVCYIYMLAIDFKTVAWDNGELTQFLTILDLIKMHLRYFCDDNTIFILCNLLF